MSLLATGTLITSLLLNSISPSLLGNAVMAYNSYEHTNNTMILVDFNLPSTDKRLWVVNMDTHQVLIQTYVAHGKGSGAGLYAYRFSDKLGSRMSELGVFRTLNTYYGDHGLSLKIEGLETSNKNTYNREIVIHGALYAGHGGHSWGCFAVPMDVKNSIINLTKDGSLIYAYHN